MRTNSIRMLVCDLDNTLYDWVGYFVPSFYAMVDKVVELTECDRDILLNDFREVHRRHHDSEHPFALLETGTIRRRFENQPRSVMIEFLNPAFHVFNSSRKRTLSLHEGVAESLESIREMGIKMVAHTESKLYGVVDRLGRLSIEKYFDRIYCRERSVTMHPNYEAAKSWLETFPLHKVTELSMHQQKPNPEVLLEICGREGVSACESAYVGDSLARDILMAKRAGVFAIWAKYGSMHDKELYTRLVRISHWTEEDVRRELELQREAKTVVPDVTAEESFREVVGFLALSPSATVGNSPAG